MNLKTSKGRPVPIKPGTGTGAAKPVHIRLATSSSMTSEAPPPMAWTRASRDMRSTGVSRI